MSLSRDSIASLVPPLASALAQAEVIEVDSMKAALFSITRKTLVILVLATFSSFSANTYADRFPGGELGDDCRARGVNYDDCGEDASCQIIGFEEDQNSPGRDYPSYGCVANSDSE